MPDILPWFKNLAGKQQSSRQRSLRNIISLLTFFSIILIILTSLVIVGFRAKQLNEIMQNKMKEVTSSFMESVDNVEQNLTLITKWNKSGSMDVCNLTVAELNSRLIPLIESDDYINAIVLIEEDTLSYKLELIDGVWVGEKKEYHPEEQGNIAKNYLTEQILNWNRESSINTSEKVFWIADDQKNSDNLYALSSVIVKDSVRIKTAVLVIDKGKLETKIASGVFAENGFLKVLLGDNQIPPLEIQDKTSVDINSIIDTVSGTDGILDRALKTYVKERVVADNVFSFHYNSRKWLGIVKDIDLGVITYRFVGLESEIAIYKENAEERNFYLMIGLVTLFVVVTSLLFIIRLYNRDRLEKNKINLQKIDNIADLIEHGESDNLEYKSTLRWNLKANKPTRDIELSVLKTVVAFLNSEGGILLVGISDDGSVLGIENDNFPNTDKFLLHFNNMIKAHIGLEYSTLIDFYITQHQSKEVLVVQCKESKEPIFLKFEDTEDFYIRVGPGSRRLSTKKAIKYINERSKR